MTSPSPGAALTTMRLLAQEKNLRTIAAGEVIIRTGDEGASIFCIVDGEVGIDWGKDHNDESSAPAAASGWERWWRSRIDASAPPRPCGTPNCWK